MIFFKLRLKIFQNIPGPVSMISNFRVFMKTNSFYFRGKKVNKSYVTIFANQGQFSLDAYFKNWLVVRYLKIITLLYS